MTKANVSQADREYALGRLFRGIAHEVANAFNSSLMNAELGRISVDEAPEALGVIAANARSGGEFVQGFARFAAATDFVPKGKAGLAQAIDLAQRLTASKARRCGVALNSAPIPDLPLIAVDFTGLGLCLALMIDSLSDAKVSAIQIEASASDSKQTVTVHFDSVHADTKLAYRFAQQIADDHGGDFVQDEQGCSISLPA